MKNSAKTKQIKVKPKRLAKAEKKNAAFVTKANEELELCRQAGEFHKAYLEVEFAAEEAYHEALQARIAELQSPVETVITTEENLETFEELEKESFGE